MKRKTVRAVHTHTHTHGSAKPIADLFVVGKLYIKYKNFKDGLFKSMFRTLLVRPFVVSIMKLNTG